MYKIRDYPQGEIVFCLKIALTMPLHYIIYRAAVL